MDITGTMVDIKHDYATEECLVTFKINEPYELLPLVDKFRDKKLKIACNIFRNKRSLDANAYLWVLLQKMGHVHKKTKDECYLDMLGEYGVFTHLLVPAEAVEKMKATWPILRVHGEVVVNGVSGIQVQCYFGSSTYDTKQMANLIDGVVQECKDLEIETLPPNEILRMKEQWGV